MTTNRKCSICSIRSIGSGKGDDADHARQMGYCNPCLTLAEHENRHSDTGHDDAGCVAMGWDTQAGVDRCWVCHPELDMTSTEVRTGTPRTDAANTAHRSHAGCDHEVTPKARAACRKAGGPKVA